MVLLNFFIGFFAIFISPHIFLYYKYKQINYSLVLAYGFILSFTSVWIITLLTYYLNLPNIIIYLLAVSVMLSSLIYIYKNKNTTTNRSHSYLIWIIAIIAMLPVLQSAGTGFNTWDAIVSWHRWALELYTNEYHPIDAAYPVLMPALWSVIYKIQGTSQIWWTAKIALFTLPVFTLALLFSFYNEYKDKTFLFIALFLYPYLLWSETIAGYVDMPVMIMGMLTLILMYAAEINKGNKNFEYYVYASLFLAGITSITKQAGIAFILFDFLYILLNIKLFTNKKQLLIISLGILLYFITYLSIYYLNATHGATGNIEWLKSISKGRYENKQLLWDTFFSYPPNIPLLNPLSKLISSVPIMPYLMGLGLLLFIFKHNRRYRSISLLSVIFLIIGFFAWGKYFSYDARNSYWVKTFLIMFLSINLSYFFSWYKSRSFTPIFISLPLIMIVLIYFLTLDNDFAYSKQKHFQSRLATAVSANQINNLMKDKDPCLHLYTNYYFLLYDWNTQEIQNKITAKEYDLDFIRKSVENSCVDGAYIVFRPSTPHYPIWKTQIKKLIKDKKIIAYNESRYVFYVPPFTQLENDYFEGRTEFINKQLVNYSKNIKFVLSETTLKNGMYTIDGWAFIENAQIDNTQKYILLKNKNKEYYVETKMIFRPDVTNHFKAKDLIKSGLQAYIYKKDFPKGTYDVYILLEDTNNEQYLIDTTKKLEI